MEKLMDKNDKEYMKMAMLKHEQAFREQVHELHRLYKIQETLMKNNNAKTTRNDYGSSGCSQPETQIHFTLERATEEFHRAESGGKCRVYDDEDLELTLGSRSYNYQRKTKAAEPGRPVEFGSGFSSGSSNVIKRTRGLTREEMSNPPWLRALSLNMT